MDIYDNLNNENSLTNDMYLCGVTMLFIYPC